MIIIPVLDFHVIHKCNFTCDSCSDFTNHDLPGKVSLEDAKKSFSYWNKRIKPKTFNILGGEPLMRKDIIDFLYLSREMWGDCEIGLITNGILLDKHPELPKVLSELDINLWISLHSDDDVYKKVIRKKLKILETWTKKYKFSWGCNADHKHWSLIYKGYGNSIEPFEDNDAEASWNNCFMNGECFQLHQDMIWKCPPIAYLPLMSEKYKLSKKWEPYLKYKPLTYDATDKEVEEFFNRQSEDVCKMCPANKTIGYKPVNTPMMSVKRKERLYNI
jgi:hypothetical protein